MDIDIQGHKHTGWEVYSNLNEYGLDDLKINEKASAQVKSLFPMDYKYPKESWDKGIWSVCKDGYVHEESEEAKMITADILELTKSSQLTRPSIPSYYFYPTEPVLIYSVTDTPGDFQVGYLDIVEFETWRKDSNFTFIINLRDNIQTINTSYVIEIDCDHNTTGATGAIVNGIDYEAKVDYKSNQFCLSEWNPVGSSFTRLRDLEELRIEGNKLTVTVSLKDIALTWPSFVAVSNLYSDEGGLLMRDTTPPWWWK